MARRLVEAGVRFVQVTHGNWDHHFNLRSAIENTCRQVDRPIAGLLADLADRGLLQETLVIWGGEFGRTPHSQGSDGRDHNNKGFSLWMAGGGVKRGMAYGATDEYGYEAVDKRMHSNSDGKLDDREAEAAGEQLRTMLTEGKAGFRRPEGLRAAPRTDGNKPQLPGGKSQLPGGKARLREYLQQGKALPQDTGMPKDGKVPGGAGKLDRGGLGADPGFRRPPQ